MFYLKDYGEKRNLRIKIKYYFFSLQLLRSTVKIECLVEYDKLKHKKNIHPHPTEWSVSRIVIYHQIPVIPVDFIGYFCLL